MIFCLTSNGGFMVIMVDDIGGILPMLGICERENPIYKWMMAGGTPISGNLHIYFKCGITLMGV